MKLLTLLRPFYVWLLLVSICWADDLPPSVSRDVDYSLEVLPIFKKHCFSCHGSEKQEAGLRLDLREPAMQGGDSGKSILPGNSESSRLMQYVAGANPEQIMPPEGDPLTPDEIGILRAWIEHGAVWPSEDVATIVKNSHWAYQPLRSNIPPAVKTHFAVRNPIDQFIVANLESRAMEPSPEADRITLIRRLHLDLLGLLPSPEEVIAFVQDASPNAYEELVDRLLQSPHFGERWGRHWLDMARYADSDGYEKDNARPDAYRWRDWVIDAINQDMPFDQFTIEQLAGDLLPDATDMQRLATAFHRQTLTNTEGGADQEQFRVEACFDRTETTGAIWLGLTVGCARCHTHKYDAITQREYYQLFSFFNNGDEQTHVVPKSADEIQSYRYAKQDFDAKLAELEQQLHAAREKLIPMVAEWETEVQTKLKELAAKPLNRQGLSNPLITSQEEGVRFELQKDGSYLVGGSNPESTTYLIVGRADFAFDTIRIDVLPDNSLPSKGPGRVAHGNFVLSEISVEKSVVDAEFSRAEVVEIAQARADYEQNGNKSWLAKDAIDGDPATGWAVGPQYGKNHWIELQLKEPQAATGTRFFRISLKQLYGKQHSMGRFKLTLQSGHDNGFELPQEIVKILATATNDRTQQDQAQLLEYVSREAPSTKPLLEQIEELKKKEPPKPELSVRVIAQRTKNPRETFVLRRGEFLEPLTDAQVKPSGISTLPRLIGRDASSLPDRLDLARWLVSKENPLTPRVTVNQVWRHLFGMGIVKTTSDFGVRGDRPTHPELLDWLAAEFTGLNGTNNAAASHIIPWSRKSLIRLICLSATYRQSSHQSHPDLQLDPQNQWLARQSRMRVEGEIVRDISLHAAGLLSTKIGGPSVFPLLPPGIAELSYAGNFKWNVSSGSDQYRRGMYTFFKRTSPHPNLITFDCPDANLTCIDRGVSNTPLQALVTLNNASFTEASRGLAIRLLSLPDAKSDAARLDAAFQICLARLPQNSERKQLIEFLETSRSWYSFKPEEAEKFVDQYKIPTATPAEVAAWAATARVLINLDEFITRE